MEPAEASTAARLCAQADAFRADVAALLEPGGLTPAAIRRVGRWLDGPVWRLLDEQRQLLASIANRAGRAGRGA